MTSRANTMRRAGATRWLAIPAIWLLASIVASARGGVVIGLNGRITPVPWTSMLRDNLLLYGVWAALSPPVIAATRRIERIRAGVALRLAAHAASALVFVCADFLIQAFIPLGRYSVIRGWRGVWSILPEAVSIYALIAVAAVAMTAHDRVAERERELAVMRLQLLRAQLEPHFLFNSLHAISALIDFRPRDARRMLAGLSDLLRHTVQFVEHSEVPLGREVDWLEQYVELQQLRHEDRLVVDFDFAPDTLAAMLPPLLLQPLVENAIKHGVEPRAAGGRIDVSARRDGDALLLRVWNDGPALGAASSSRGSGVGLRNVRERLASVYGDDWSLDLRDAAEGGVEAIVTLPFHASSAAGAA